MTASVQHSPPARRQVKLRGALAKLALAAAFALGMALVPAQGSAQDSAAPIRLGLIEAMSGPFASGGAVVRSNLDIAIAAVNQAGGVRLADGPHRLELHVFDSNNSTEQALLGLTQMADSGVDIILQGNGSAVAPGPGRRHRTPQPAQPGTANVVPQLFSR